MSTLSDAPDAEEDSRKGERRRYGLPEIFYLGIW